MEREDANRDEAVKKELKELAEVLRRACVELEEMIAEGKMLQLCVTSQLNWMYSLKRRREVMLMELARHGWKDGTCHVD